MRITAIDLYLAAMPMKIPFRIAIGVTVTSTSLLVVIHTDTGLSGIGEGNIFTPVVGETPETAREAAIMLARQLIGTDPTDIEARSAQMRRALPLSFTTRSAFDIALWDLLGKAANLPLFALLGGGRRAIVTDNTVGLDNPAVMAERALAHTTRGFRAVKVKLGQGLDTDVARVHAIRAAVGNDVAIRLDANQGWNRMEAIRALNAIAPDTPEFCEQPLARWDIDGLAALSRISPVPIMADEAVFDDHDAQQVVSANACDLINIKLAKSGGLFTALKINAVAESAGVPCMIGCMTESGIALSAAVHFASARSNVVYADLDSADMLGVDAVRGGFAYGAGGELMPGTGPGLGVDIDPAFLAAQQPIPYA